MKISRNVLSLPLCTLHAIRTQSLITPSPRCFSRQWLQTVFNSRIVETRRHVCRLVEVGLGARQHNRPELSNGISFALGVCANVNAMHLNRDPETINLDVNWWPLLWSNLQLHANFGWILAMKKLRRLALF